MDLELIHYITDGTVHLQYEDWRTGKDRDFILREDGTVVEVDYDENDRQVLTLVNLVDTLREMVLSDDHRD